MHFCHEELFAIMAAIPAVGIAFRRLRAWWCSRRGHSHASHDAAVAREGQDHADHQDAA